VTAAIGRKVPVDRIAGHRRQLCTAERASSRGEDRRGGAKRAAANSARAMRSHHAYQRAVRSSLPQQYAAGIEQRCAHLEPYNSTRG
jgi:hypothetical protein